MSAKWEYWTILVEWLPTPMSTRRRPESDWIADFSDGTWVGWDEILDNLAAGGWEIFSVVSIPKLMQGSTVSEPNFRIFAKRHKA